MIVAMISGFSNYRAFEQYTSIHPEICGFTTKSTFHRITDILDYRLVALSLNGWLLDLLKSSDFDFDKAIVSVDGKCFNGHKLEQDGNNLQSFNIYLQEIGVLLDSVIFEGKKSHELQVCKENLSNPNFNLITADALYANQTMIQAILQVEKNYFFTSKQRKLNEGLLKQSSLEEIIYKDDRMIKVYKVPKDFEITTKYNHSYEYDYTDNPKYKRVVNINTKSTRVSWDNCQINTLVVITGESKGEQYTRYYITNLDYTLGCERFESIARKRWGVENGLNRNKDMTYNEDKHYTTKLNSIGLLSSLRNFVISILHLNGCKATVKTTRSFCNREVEVLSLLGHRKMSRV
jgi:hypothetical protein